MSVAGANLMRAQAAGQAGRVGAREPPVTQQSCVAWFSLISGPVTSRDGSTVLTAHARAGGAWAVTNGESIQPKLVEAWLEKRAGVLPVEFMPDLVSAPPTPAPRPPNGQYTFRPADDFAEIVRRVERGEFRLRRPAATKQGLLGPFGPQGDCLDPVLLAGDLFWIDPSLAARDGDFVVVRFSKREMAEFYRRGVKDPEWVRQYGLSPTTNIVTKLFRQFAGSNWLQEKQAAFPIADNQILGVIRFIKRRIRGRGYVPIYGSGERRLVIEPTPALPVHCMRMGAVSTVYSATDVGPLSVTMNAPQADKVADVLVINIDTEENTDVVEVTCSYRVAVTGNATFTVKTATKSTNLGSGLSSFTPALQKTTNVYEPQTVVGTWTQTAGSYSFGLGVEIVGNGTDNYTVTFRDINVRATVLKR